MGRKLIVNPTTGKLDYIDTTGGGSGDDKKVAIDSGATPDYLGSTENDGALRTDTTLNYIDGGNFITLGVDESDVNHNSLLNTHNLTTDIDHTLISNIGVNTHPQIDTHLSSTSNPHSVTFSQVGAIEDTSDVIKDTHIDWGTGANQVSTADIPESINLYYTESRFDNSFSGKSTTDLTEGTNLYYLDERVDDRVNDLLIAGSYLTKTYDDSGNTLTLDFDGIGLADLDDVSGLTGLNKNDILYYDGTNWVHLDAPVGFTTQYLRVNAVGFMEWGAISTPTTPTWKSTLKAGNESDGYDPLVSTGDKIEFRDSGIYITSLDDGHMDVEADIAIDLNQDTNVTGDLDVSGEIKGSKMMITMGWNGTSSGTNRDMYGAGIAFGGDTSKRGYVMTQSGSVVGVSMCVDINAYTSGDVKVAVMKNGTELCSSQFTPSGVSDGQTTYDNFSRGTYTFVAGDVLWLRRTLVGATGITTDDLYGMMEVVLDD